MARRLQVLGQQNEFVANVMAEPKDRSVLALFASATVERIAGLAVKQAEAGFGCRGARLVWTLGTAVDGQPLQACWPAALLAAHETALVDAALAQSRETRAALPHAGWLKIASPLGAAQAVLIADWPLVDDMPRESTPVWRELIALVGSALELADQRLAIVRLEKTARLQSVPFGGALSK